MDTCKQSLAINKCANFLQTLLRLTDKQVVRGPHNEETSQYELIRQLIRHVIYGNMPAEIFTKKLREALKTKSEDNLLAFVCNYIHGLKMAVQSGEQRLDGIGTYNEYWGISEKTSICSTKKIKPSLVFLNPQQKMKDLMAVNTSNTYLNSMNVFFRNFQILNEHSSLENQLFVENIKTPQNSFLNFQKLMRLIGEAMPDSNGVEYDVLVMISNAVESKVRALLSKLVTVTTHRLESLKSNPHYKQLDNPQKQLRFVENIDREMLAKSQDKNTKIPETYTKQTFKQIQIGHKELAKNCEANNAALNALGFSKRHAMKDKYIARNPNFRAKQITMQDLIFVMSRDSKFINNNLLYKAAFGYDK